MGKGAKLVDGFRRYFHRRTASDFRSNQSSAGEKPSELEVIEDPDLAGLRAIRLPRR